MQIAIYEHEEGKRCQYFKIIFLIILEIGLKYVIVLAKDSVEIIAMTTNIHDSHTKPLPSTTFSYILVFDKRPLIFLHIPHRFSKRPCFVRSQLLNVFSLVMPSVCHLPVNFGFTIPKAILTRSDVRVAVGPKRRGKHGCYFTGRGV